MDVTAVVAENVKAIRTKKRLTLDAAAALTGVSRSMLAQIEKGEVNPTISVLWKIANGYKVSFTSLVEDGQQEVAVLRQAEAKPLAEDEGRYVNYPLFPFDDEHLFETYRIHIKPGGQLSAQPHLEGSEEYITVFAGQLRITVDGQNYELAMGDSIRFHADVAHAYYNLGTEDTELSMLIYYRR